ncbi:MAG TPA: hypothetical protein VM869_11680, partial [Enhygromyxa sp.]|nr:hypothetical protein [Enhygromyxa sp.]
QLENYAADGTPGWTSDALPNADYHELAADPHGNVYVLASAADPSSFSLHKLDDTGALVWTVDHDDADVLDTATGLVLLPGGAILVAGYTNGAPNQPDGLLSWYDGDGNLLHERTLDGMADDDGDVFTDVAVSPGGTHAVAVGGRREAGGDGDLWIYKFEI